MLKSSGAGGEVQLGIGKVVGGGGYKSKVEVNLESSSNLYMSSSNLDIALSKGSNLDSTLSKGLVSKGFVLDISLPKINFDKHILKTKNFITNNLISNKFVSVDDKNLVFTVSKVVVWVMKLLVLLLNVMVLKYVVAL